jgi:chromosome segregation ATPase
VEDERAATQQLTDKARGLLNSDGHELTAARIEQVSETLHAAALDPDARAKVQDACLERELRHVGLGGLRATRTAPARKLRTSRRDAGERLKAAREAEAHARRELAEAARGLRTAEQQHERAMAELSAAEEALASARELAAAAEERHREAKRRLEEAKP